MRVGSPDSGEEVVVDLKKINNEMLYNYFNPFELTRAQRIEVYNYGEVNRMNNDIEQFWKEPGLNKAVHLRDMGAVTVNGKETNLTQENKTAIIFEKTVTNSDQKLPE